MDVTQLAILAGVVLVGLVVLKVVIKVAWTFVRLALVAAIVLVALYAFWAWDRGDLGGAGGSVVIERGHR